MTDMFKFQSVGHLTRRMSRECLNYLNLTRFCLTAYQYHVAFKKAHTLQPGFPTGACTHLNVQRNLVSPYTPLFLVSFNHANWLRMIKHDQYMTPKKTGERSMLLVVHIRTQPARAHKLRKDRLTLKANIMALVNDL